MSARIAVVGSINADLYVRIPRLPRPGETISGEDAAMRPGGKGANQAAAAARLGAHVAFLGQVGDDAYAPALRTALAESGVDTAGLRTVPGACGQASILLQEGGENSIILVGGANQAWAGLPSDTAVVIAGSQALMLQREVPEAINLAAAQAARSAKVPVVLDAGGVEGPLDPALLACIDVLSPNESELARLTDMPTDNDEQVIAAARWLQARGVATVLVKLGARGSLLLEGPAAPLRQGVFAVEVVDTTGAGDCFTAAYVVAQVDGKSAADRLRFAAAAAALCVTKIGAMPAMPDRAAVEAVLGYDRRGERSAVV